MIETTLYIMFGSCTVAFLVMAIVKKFKRHESCTPESDAYEKEIHGGYLYAKESECSVVELFELIQLSKDMGDYNAFDRGVEKYIAEMQDKENYGRIG